MRNSVSPYDATYVALAEQLGVPLLTCDARLGRAHGHDAEVIVYPEELSRQRHGVERGGAVEHRPRAEPAPVRELRVDGARALLQPPVGLVGVALPAQLGALAVRGPLGGDGPGHRQVELVIGHRDAEPLDLQLAHPPDHLAVGVLTQACGVVGGVGGDVAVDQHDVVPAQRLAEHRRRGPAVEREQDGHAVDGVAQVPEPAVERVAGELGVHVVVVAGEGEAGDARAELPAQGAGQGPLARAVESFDDDQSAHRGDDARYPERDDGRSPDDRRSRTARARGLDDRGHRRAARERPALRTRRRGAESHDAAEDQTPASAAAPGARARIPVYIRVELDPPHIVAYGIGEDGLYVEIGRAEPGQLLELTEPFPISLNAAVLLR